MNTRQEIVAKILHARGILEEALEGISEVHSANENIRADDEQYYDPDMEWANSFTTRQVDETIIKLNVTLAVMGDD